MTRLKQTTRSAARAMIGAIAVTFACLASVFLAPASPAPALVFSCFAFAALGAFSGRSAVLGAVGVGALELALVLPGQGFAVSHPDDALGLIGAIGAGLLIAARAGRSDDRLIALTQALHHEAAATQSATVFLDELSHRVVNDFAMLAAFISIEARAHTPETRAALEHVNERLVVLGRVYRYLQIDRRGVGQIDSRAFLTDLCTDLGYARAGLRPLSICLAIEPVALAPAEMAVVGLILNELLTNVYKHAYPEGRAGELSVVFDRHRSRRDRAQLIVTDDGVGFIKRGETEGQRGRRLVGALAAKLDGDISYARIDGLTMATLEFPLHAA
jgi:two-component sensor histidine kinase